MKPFFDLSQIDMNLLVVFDILVREQSLTQTALKLNLTTPAVSGAVKRLQQLLNDPVVIRQGRGVQPTPRAMQLHGQLEPMLVSISEALRFFESDNTPNLVTIGMPGYMDVLILPALFKGFRHKDNLQLMTRELKIHSSGSIEDSILSRKFDMVITPIQTTHHSLICEPVSTDEMVLTYQENHPVFSRELLTEKNFLDERHIALEYKIGGTSIYDFWMTPQKKNEIVACSATSPLAACQIVANSDLVTVMPSLIPKRIAQNLPLAWQTLPFQMKEMTNYVVYHSRYEDHPGVTKVKSILKQVLNA